MKNFIEKISLKKHFSFTVVFSIFLLGFFLRLYNLTYFDFWYDEAFTGLVVKQDFGEIIRLSALDLVHPPTYYLLLKLWTFILGFNDFSLRLFSVLVGSLILPFTYLLLKEVTAKKYVQLSVPFCIAINPFFIDYSQEARNYSLFAFITLIFYVQLFRILKKKEVGFFEWLALSFTMVAGVLIHYFFVFAMVVAFVLLLTRNWPFQKEQMGKKLIRLVKLFLKIFLPPFLAFVAWVGVILHYKDSLQGGMQLAPFHPLSILRSIQIFLFSSPPKALGEPSPHLLFHAVHWEFTGLLIFLIFVVIFMISFKKKFVEKAMLWQLHALWIIPFLMVIALAMLGFNKFLERYLISFGLIFVICFFYHLFSISKKIVLPILAVYLFCIVTTLPTLPPGNYRFQAQQIREGKMSGVIDDPLQFVVLKYYLSQDNTSAEGSSSRIGSSSSSGSAKILKLRSPQGYGAYQGWVLIEEKDIVQ